MLPEYDPNKPKSSQGMYRKYEVRRVDLQDMPGGKHDGCTLFVLDLTHDFHARSALYGYIESLRGTDEYPVLERELEALMDRLNREHPLG